MLRKKIFPAERRDEKGETEVVGFLSYMLVVPLLPYMMMLPDAKRRNGN